MISEHAANSFTSATGNGIHCTLMMMSIADACQTAGGYQKDEGRYCVERPVNVADNHEKR